MKDKFLKYGALILISLVIFTQNSFDLFNNKDVTGNTKKSVPLISFDFSTSKSNEDINPITDTSDEGTSSDDGAGDTTTPDEGTTDEGTTDEGTTDEGTTDEGTTDEGTTDEGTTDPDSTDEGTTDPDSTDEGTTDPDSTDEGTTDEGTTDEGTTDEGTTDEGTTDEGTTDDGTTDEGTTDEGTTDEGTTDEGTTDEGTTDEGTTDDGTTDEGTTEDDTTDPDSDGAGDADGTGTDVCVCDTPCSDDLPNPDCDACVADENGVFDCSLCGAFVPDVATCICEMKCTDEMPNPDCPVCSLVVDGNYDCCLGEEYGVGTMATDPITVDLIYEGVTYDKTSGPIPITGTQEIRVSINIDASANNSNLDGKIEIDIPVGYELVYGPGINSLNSTTGAIVSKDFLGNETMNVYANTTVGWVRDYVTESSSSVATKSGTLSYNLQGNKAISMNVYVKLNPYLLRYKNGDNLEIDPITVKYTAGSGSSQENTSTTSTVQTTPYRFSVSSLSYTQEIDGFLGGIIDAPTYLVEGATDTVHLSATLNLSNYFIGTKYISNRSLVMTVDVPTGAVVTAGYSNVKPAQVTSDDATKDRYEITISGQTFNYSCSLSNFLSVQFPYDNGFTQGSYDITIVDYKVAVWEYDYANTGTKIEGGSSFSGGYVVASDNNSSIASTTTVKIEPDEDENYFVAYLPRWTSASTSTTNGNVEYTRVDETTVQLLSKVSRTYTNTSSDVKTSYTDVEYTLNYAQVPVVDDYIFSDTSGGFSGEGYDPDYAKANGTLRDNVSSVTLATPLLGNIDKYSTSIKSIEVQYVPAYSDDNPAPIYNDMLSAIETYTITDFSSVTGWLGSAEKGYYPPISTDHDEDGNTFTSSTVGNFSLANSNISASYACRNVFSGNATYSNITVTAPAGKSILSVTLVFAGDNNTYTDGAMYAYGRPISNVPPDGDKDSYSDHSFTMAMNLADMPRTTVNGFRWKENVDFTLTAGRYTSDVGPTIYSYNTASNNFQMHIGNWSNNPRGYLDLAIMGYTNNSGSTSDSVVMKITTNYGYDQLDVVKEISFPYNTSDPLGKEQIDRIEYKYYDDPNEYVYELGFHGVSNAPFTLTTRSRQSSAENKFYQYNQVAYMQAPGDKSFEYMNIYYASWNANTTPRYAMLKGYVNNHDLETRNAETQNIHYFQVYYREDGQAMHGNLAGKRFTDISSENVNFSVLNTTYVDDGSGMQEANVLTAGRSNTLQYKIYAGNSLYTETGYVGIAFDVVLPDTMVLQGASATNMSTVWNNNYYGSYFSAGEPLSSMSISAPIAMTEAELVAQYGADYKSLGISGANKYRVIMDDEFVRIYGFYAFKSPYDLNQVGFTLSLDVLVYVQAAGIDLSYDKILYVGSTRHQVGVTTHAKGLSGDGARVSALDMTALTSQDSKFGTTFQYAVSGKSSSTGQVFMKVDSLPFVSVHSAYVTDGDGVDFTYKSGDENSIAKFTETNEKGSMTFSITSTITSDEITNASDREAYVYIPLPLGNNSNSLIDTQNFDVALDYSSGSPIEIYEAGTYGQTAQPTAISTIASYSDVSFDTKAQAKIEAKFRSLPASTDIINMHEVRADFDEASSSIQANSDTLVLKLIGLELGETYDVKINFTAPSNDTDEGTIDLSAIAIYNYTDNNLENTNIFFGGRTPPTSYMTVNPDLVANNPINFEFSVPKWKVDFSTLLAYEEADPVIITAIYHDDFKYASAGDNSVSHETVYTLPTGVSISGYNFYGWYSDSALSIPISGSTYVITEDTTFYAKYKPIWYPANYFVETNLVHTEISSWDRPGFITSFEKSLKDNTVSGADFQGWSATENGSLISDYDKFADLVNNDHSVSSLSLYGVYDYREYTIGYNYSYGGTSIAPITVNWTDDNLTPDFSLTIPGQDFLGWFVVDTDIAVSQSTTYQDIRLDPRLTDIPNDDTTSTATGQAYVIVLEPRYEDTKYTVKYDTNSFSIGSFADRDVNWSTTKLQPTEAEPSILGKTFLGWGTSATDSSSVIDIYASFSTAILNVDPYVEGAKVLTLFAHFKDNEYTVVYDFNDGNYYTAPSPITKTGTVKWESTNLEYQGFIESTFDGTTSIFPAGSGDYFKETYIFNGWYLDKDFSGTKYSQDDIKSMSYSQLAQGNDSEDNILVLYARYDIVRYAITYLIAETDGAGNYLAQSDIDYLLSNASLYQRGRQKANDVVLPTSSGDTFAQQKGSAYDYSTGQFTIDGYNFVDWKIGTRNDLEVEDTRAETNIGSNVDTNTLYFESHGYSPSEWDTAVKDDTMPNDLSVFATFTPIDYNIKYAGIDDNGIVVDVTSFATGTTVTWQGGGLLSGVTLGSEFATGKQFNGWYYNDGTADIEVTEDTILSDLLGNVTPTGDITITAKFGIVMYNVNFDYAGKKDNVSQDFALDQAITLTTPIVEGFTFAGWFTSFDYSTEILEENYSKYTYQSYYEAINPSESPFQYDNGVTFFAKWVLDINVIVSKDIINYDVSDNDDITGSTPTEEFTITNNSKGTILMYRTIYDKDENWEFVQELSLPSSDLDSATTAMIQEVADINDISFDTARQVLVDLNLFDIDMKPIDTSYEDAILIEEIATQQGITQAQARVILIDLELISPNTPIIIDESGLTPNEMKVTLTTDEVDEIIAFHSDFSQNTISNKITQSQVIKISTKIDYLLNQQFPQQTSFTLFQLEYSFGI